MFGVYSVESIKDIVTELLLVLVCDECYDESDKDTLREEANKRFFTEYPNGDKELFKICLAKELHEENQIEESKEEPINESKEEPKEVRLENDEVYKLVAEMLSSLSKESSNMSEMDLKKEVRRRMREQYKNIDRGLVPACCKIWFEERKKEKQIHSSELKLKCENDEQQIGKYIGDIFHCEAGDLQHCEADEEQKQSDEKQEKQSDEKQEKQSNEKQEKQSNEKQEKQSDEKQEKQIIYDTIIAKKESDKLKSISFDEVDKYDFRKGFNEFIKNESFVHLYFDFDQIKSEEELLDVFKWLDSLKNTFGDYSIGGYSDSIEISKKYDFKYIQDGGHYLSMHVVFYTTRINSSELVQIMKHTTKKGFATKGIHPLCDPAPYKLNKRQVFRHVLSDKIFNSGNENNRKNAGTILNNLPPSTQIIQVRGNEPIVTKDLWKKHFELNEREVFKNAIKTNKELITNSSQSSKSKNSPYSTIKPEDWIGVTEPTVHIPVNESGATYGIESLEYSEKPIILNEEKLMELLNEFPSEFNYFESVMSNLLHSPYDKEFVESVLLTWYNKREHHNGFPQAYIDNYYERTESNKWFYSIINHLPKDRKIEWLDEVRYQSVDEEACIDLKDEFSWPDLEERDYRLPGGIGVNINKFLSDLRRVAVFVDLSNPYVIIKDYSQKDKSEEINVLNAITDDRFRKNLKRINLGKYRVDGKIKNVTACMVYDEDKNKKWIKKHNLYFNSNDPKVFCYFRGYNYKRLEAVNLTKINPYLNHIREVIASGDETLYNYILNWIAFVIQKPGIKTKTALVFTGRQGAGKNAFTDVISNLTSPYSIKNLTNIENIVGRFNALLENKMLIVCNELTSSDANKLMNPDTLKSIVTDKTIQINQKGIPQRTVENVVNLIMLSNHFDPVKIDDEDRRYVMNEVDGKYAKNFEYFKQLFKSINAEGFYENLLTFFLTRDISEFEPTQLPETETRNEVIEFSKSSYQLFYEQYYNRFCKGWHVDSSFERYKDFVQQNGFAMCSKQTFGKYLKRFVDRIRKKEDGKAKWFYYAKKEVKKPNLDELEEFEENNDFDESD